MRHSVTNPLVDQILNSAPIGSSIVATDGTILHANARLCDILGVPLVDLLGTNAGDYWADKDHRDKVLSSLSGGADVTDEEAVFRDSGGGLVNVLLSLQNSEFSGNTCIFGWIYDITERKRAEERFKSLLESAPDATVIVDSTGRIVQSNLRMTAVFGYEPEDLLGEPVEILLPERLRDTHVDHRASFFAEPRVRAMGEGLELWGQTRDGREFPIEISLSPISTEEGTLVSASVRDITERMRAENRFKSLLESAPDATVFVDDTGHIVQSNLQMKSVFGYEPAELIGAPVEILLPERLRDTHVHHRASFFAEPRVRAMGEGLELWGQTRDGREFPIEISLSPISTEDGTLVSASVRDITARLQAERALRESRQLLASVLENNPVGISFTREGKGIAFSNARMGQLFGMTQQEYEATDIRDFYPNPDDYDRVVDTMRQQGSVNGLEVLQQRKDRSRFWAEVYLMPTSFSGDQGWIAVIQDVTERRQAEDSLKEAKQRLDLALEGSGYGLWDWNVLTGELIFDAQWARIAGHEPADLEFRIETWQSMANEEDIRRIREKNPVEQRSDETFEHEVRLKHKKGHWVWTLSRGRVVSRDPEGKPARIIGTVLDMSPRKSAEQELEKAKHAAETALAELKTAQEQLVKTEKMASLGQLTAGIAHEIKNPLNFINNFSETSVELLEELDEAINDNKDQLTEDAREDIEETLDLLRGDMKKIASHGKRADGIVKSMLLHARGDSAQRVPTDLNELVREAYNLAYHGERARDTSFNVSTTENFDDAAGEVVLVPQEITRVLVNILSNAFYAMMEKHRSGAEAGYQPELKLSTRGDPDAVEIRLRDNGTGIPDDVRKNLFDPFFTTKPTGSGTGLGLSMSFDIVAQQHGGSLDVTSEDGAFSEFVIRLPRNRQPDKIASGGTG